VQKAQETLDIIASGQYYTGGKIVNIKSDLAESLAASRHYTDDHFATIGTSAEAAIAVLNYKADITVDQISVLEGTSRLATGGHKVGCLNFASAKNPGGGFLNGAVAQEESLAMSSTLYASQMQHFAMYEHNRARSTYLYSDHMIYSPGVVVFRDDEGELLREPYPLTIITSPAVNVGAMRVNRPEELKEVEATMMGRIDKLLALFVHHQLRHLLLGAWGCGVFQNDPSQIAAWFARYLTNGGKYSRCFEQVQFAVYDRSKEQKVIQAFQQTFK
jgi:uncharacterized protein (TIGR02452 family)